MINSFSFKDRL